MLKRSLIFLAIISFAMTAYADIARPDKTPGRVKKPVEVDSYLGIRLDRDAKEATLIIPRSSLNSLRAELDAIDANGDVPVVASASGISRIQMIVSGMFLSLALVLAGIWFTKSGRAGKSAGAAMLIFSAGALATIVYGNAGPPSEARSITGKMFSPAVHQLKWGGGRIKLQVSNSEEQLKLIVPDPPTEPAKTPGE